MNMDDIKLRAKNEKKLEAPLQEVGIYSDDIVIEIVIVKCATLIIKREKRQMTEGIELTN